MSALLVYALFLGLQAKPYVWIEGEDPTSTNLKPQISGWGHKEMLSGEKWLQVSIDAEKVDKELPADGGLISYSFTTSSAGKQEIWNRIGYEFARSPFDWRVDQSDWKRVGPDELTTDMEEFETWNEVAWLELSEQNLEAGPHTLQIRLPKTVDSKGKPERVLYASDALLITSTHFHPNGKFKPDGEYRTDEDRKAEQTAFAVPDQPTPQQQVVPLAGLWQISRDDEQLPGPVDQPIGALPNDPKWYGISVPGDKNSERPELAMAHRIWYKTSFSVSQSQARRSFRLTFPQNSLNTTVYVNGKLCGFNKNPFVSWSCDVTPGVKAGNNELLVGIRDAWYGYSTNPNDPMKLRKSFVIPLSFSGSGFLDLAYPVWHAFESGILDTPRLTVGGPVMVTDVFVKPSVAQKALNADVTVRNSGAEPVHGSLLLEAVDDHSGAVAHKFEPKPFEISAGEEATLPAGGPWSDPTLWWPDTPTMYRLRATVSIGDSPQDVSDTSFGFREWSVRGKDVLLNGVVWHGWAELTEGASKEQWLQSYHNTGQRFMRLAGASQNGGIGWRGMSFEQALDWFDRNGVVVRRCGPLDGEAIGYWAIENDPVLQALYHTRIKKQLLDNWRDQMVAQVKGERNHPSIGMWSVENEWLYINCINLYGDLMDQFEAEEKATFDAVAAVDPTRPAMADGGGAGKLNQFPIQGDHYAYTNDPTRYPDLAYQAFPEGAGRGRWRWDEKRPRYVGEEFYATGISPADYAWIQGESAFGGKVESEQGMALVQRMLMEGYRWSGEYAAWHLWIGDEGAKYDKHRPNAERAVFCRQQDWSFGSGQKVDRTFGIFNDSHSSEPLTFSYVLQVGGKPVQSYSKQYQVAPGTNVKFDESLQMPHVSQRGSGELLLKLQAGGSTVFQDRKPFSVLPAPHVEPEAVALYDPSGTLAPRLSSLGFVVHSVGSLSALPASAKLVVVGPDALSEADSTSTALAAYAEEGHRVLVLDQAHPLRFQALPASMDSTGDGGAFAFPEDSGHPAFRGLEASDFRVWPSGVYRNAYVKPERGAKSLMQVGSRLSETALVEMPVGKGLLMLCQIRTGSGAAGSQLLANLVEYSSAYKLVYRPVFVAAADDLLLLKALDRTGLHFTPKPTPLEAIDGAANGIAIVSASPANLHALVQQLGKVKSFMAGGGTIVFHGLTPEGLSDYDRIIGVEHMIRPFRREKTAIRYPRDPLASGLSASDVVMYSGEKMFDFNSDMFVASDIFSNVVDYDDAAPFAKLADDYLYNTVNGFVSADSWKYIYSFDLDHNEPRYTMKFPKPQTFTEMTWIGNGFYHKVKRFSLTFDGRETVNLDVEPNNLPQVLKISPPRTGQSVELRILDWTRDEQGSNVVGIDNISLKAQRPPEFYKTVHPLLNVGGLVRYDEGKGSAVLVNLLFKDREDVPENAGKKLAIFSTVLRNLGAPLSEGRTVVAGATDVQYQTVDISKKANQYRNDRGWFGDRNTTFADLPAGKHVFAGVPFEVFDFPTSPVPTAVMLGGPGVPGGLPDSVNGIPVHAKLSALFFLQAARVDRPRSDREKNVELAHYVVHYADGQTLAVPIDLGVNVDDYREDTPQPLPGAQLAWVGSLGAGSKQKAAAYMQQWTNPRPDVEIESIDLAYGQERRGVPALLAVTGVR